MPLSPTYPVRSARLLLRPLTEPDAGALLAYRSRADVCRWVPFEPMDMATILNRLSTNMARTTIDEEGDTLFLGVELAGGGPVVGDVMLRWVSEVNQCGEIGWMLNPWFGGHGYATEAAHMLLHLAFDKLGLHRVIARVDARNLPSSRLAARLGMRQEAHLVENEWFKGAWSDELDFALLSPEWRTQHEVGCPSPGALTSRPGGSTGT